MPARYPASPIGPASTAALLLAYLVVAVGWTEVLVGRWTPAGLIWPASGIGLALVLLRGTRVWPWLGLIALVRVVIALEPQSVAAVAAEILSNVAAAVVAPIVAAMLIWKLTGERYLERAGAFVVAMLVAAPVGALVGSAPGAALGELPLTFGPLEGWYAVSAADLMGMLALAPPICIWARYPLPSVESRRVPELVALMAVVVVVLVLPTAAQARYLLVAAHIAIALRLPLQWSAASVAVTSLAYLALGAVELRAQAPPSVHVFFLSYVAFVIILNLAAYVAALLHMEIRDRAAQLADLARALSGAEERERRRIAQVLHDHLQQVLVAAKLALGGQTDERIERARSRIDEAIAAARTLMMELHPPALDEGLAMGLRWLAWHVHDAFGLEVALDADDEAEPASPEIRAFLFQSTRELLLNVVNHAGTDLAWVRLRRDGDFLCIEVEDRGVGCDPRQALRSPAAGRQYGLPAIRQRVELLGGRFGLHSECGCRVVIAVPIGIEQADF